MANGHEDVSHLETARGAGKGQAGAASRSGAGWPPRLGSVVRRRDVRASHPRSGRRIKRGGLSGEPSDHALGRSRGGYGTKIHLVTDGQGVPLVAVVTAGQAHESKSFEATLEAIRIPQRGSGRPRRRPRAVAADKAYSQRRIRRWLHRHKIEPMIPQRTDQVGRRGGHRKFDRAKYRRRNVVERCVSWLKDCRRVATRYEKLALNYLGMVDLAIAQRLLRLVSRCRTLT